MGKHTRRALLLKKNWFEISLCSECQMKKQKAKYLSCSNCNPNDEFCICSVLSSNICIFFVFVIFNHCGSAFY